MLSQGTPNFHRIRTDGHMIQHNTHSHKISAPTNQREEAHLSTHFCLWKNRRIISFCYNPIRLLCLSSITIFHWFTFSIWQKLLLLKINFYWSMVDLQCCISFRCTVKWINLTEASNFSSSTWLALGSFMQVSRLLDGCEACISG